MGAYVSDQESRGGTLSQVDSLEAAKLTAIDMTDQLSHAIKELRCRIDYLSFDLKDREFAAGDHRTLDDLVEIDGEMLAVRGRGERVSRLLGAAETVLERIKVYQSSEGGAVVEDPSAVMDLDD